jgi:hypothetical protein
MPYDRVILPHSFTTQERFQRVHQDRAQEKLREGAGGCKKPEAHASTRQTLIVVQGEHHEMPELPLWFQL